MLVGFSLSWWDTFLDMAVCCGHKSVLVHAGQDVCNLQQLGKLCYGPEACIHWPLDVNLVIWIAKPECSCAASPSSHLGGLEPLPTPNAIWVH